MRRLAPVILFLGGVVMPAVAPAQTAVQAPTDLKHYNVTIRRFDPQKPTDGQEFVLPVDSPDEEHAIASTIANAASWPGKVAADGRPGSMAFMAVRVERR